MHGVNLSRLRFWCQFKVFPFRVNFLLFATTVGLAILFSLFSQPEVKICIALLLSLTLGMLFLPLIEFVSSIAGIIKWWHKLSEAKPIYSFGLMEEISNIASYMRLKIKDNHMIRVVNGWINAAVLQDGKIILGQPIVEEFDKEIREGILGHELGHRKGNHWIKRALLLLLATPLFCYLAILPFPWYVNYLLLFAAMGLIMPLISWPFEYQADTIAAKYVGKEKVIWGLMKLATSANMDINQDSYTHPSIARRIRRLQKSTFPLPY